MQRKDEGGSRRRAERDITLTLASDGYNLEVTMIAISQLV
jgi:hypothetical protein